LRIAFAGTPEFARAALAALVEAGHEVALVLTQPDRPAGRGLRLQPSAVKAYALAQALALAQPRSLRLDGRYADDAQAARSALAAAAPELIVVAAYGLILPRWTLELPRFGCLNIHASLLPRWRGAAPIQRAIEAGDAQTGITLMRMDEGLDTGPMLAARAIDIAPDETGACLLDRLAALGAQMVVQALADPGRLAPQPQPEAGVTHARKVEKAEGAIDWAQPAAQLERRIRAFDPFPGCTAQVQGVTLKVWRARVVDAGDALATPGARIDLGRERIVVACGQGALELLQVQPPGGVRMTATQWLRSTRSRSGGATR
jgi:methionyl-tRNA formyltransferase